MTKTLTKTKTKSKTKTKQDEIKCRSKDRECTFRPIMLNAIVKNACQ